MRVKELTIYSQYFRFLLEDDRAITGSEPYSPVIAAVTYDNERQTVACTCSNDVPCEHKAFIHEVISKEKESTLFRFLEDCREKSAQTITRGTINRLRGAFAREYNLAKGVVQYPERRLPLGWQGGVPGSKYPSGNLSVRGYTEEWQRAIFDAASNNSTTSAADVTVDPAKFKEDINKAKELLEKKTKPKPEKPAKPRTRFTDLEL